MIARANQNSHRNRRPRKRARRWNIKPQHRDLMIRRLAMVLLDSHARATDRLRAMNLLLTAEAQNQKDEHRQNRRNRRQLKPLIFHFPTEHDPDSLMIAIDPTIDLP